MNNTPQPYDPQPRPNCQVCGGQHSTPKGNPYPNGVDGRIKPDAGIGSTEPSKDVSGVTIAEIKTIGETHPDGNRATSRAQPTEPIDYLKPLRDAGVHTEKPKARETLENLEEAFDDVVPEASDEFEAAVDHALAIRILRTNHGYDITDASKRIVSAHRASLEAVLEELLTHACGAQVEPSGDYMYVIPETRVKRVIRQFQHPTPEESNGTTQA